MTEHRNNSKDFRTPPGTATFGMALFLISLAMLFAASMVGYVIIRVTGRAGPPPGSLRLPWGFWLSTLIMLVSSGTIHHALRSVRIDRQRAFRLAMLLTTILGFAFLIVQAPNLYGLLQVHHQSVRGHNVYLYGLVVMLIGLHAAHVIGGLIPLTIATARARKGNYNAGSHEGVKHCVMYWHFLDMVWILLFLVFLLTG